MLLFTAVVLQSCRERVILSNQTLEMSAFSDLKRNEYALNSRILRNHLRNIIHADKDSAFTDFRVRDYYLRDGKWMWIDRKGVDYRADLLLQCLDTIDRIGFSREKFCVDQMKNDLRRVRELAFDDSTGTNDVNEVVARLEYNLTKNYLRYVCGQRYGFVDPYYVFNRLDIAEGKPAQKGDTVAYQKLFDIPIEQPSSAFFSKAYKQIRCDSIDSFLKKVQPTNPTYRRLVAYLHSDSLKESEKSRIVCNIERCRWRITNFSETEKKYVLVNVPAFQLYAHDDNNVMSMRVGCGKTKTKTPLLTSSIKRMDLNPQWFIPRSIIDKDIIRHAGNKSYFDRHRYYVRDRRTGKRVNYISWGVLKNPRYVVVQEGGPGNSLGRIIFRFDNEFSVFLHDTSSPEFFTRDYRGVSHGCVRVQNPFDLAVFLLEKKDKKLIDQIAYSMTADITEKDTLNKDRMIDTYHLKHEVPICIAYYTAYPDENNQISIFPDVYGYDRAMYKHLRIFL